MRERDCGGERGGGEEEGGERGGEGIRGDSMINPK